jgi:hypothetical protein
MSNCIGSFVIDTRAIETIVVNRQRACFGCRYFGSTLGPLQAPVSDVLSQHTTGALLWRTTASS